MVEGGIVPCCAWKLKSCALKFKMALRAKNIISSDSGDSSDSLISYSPLYCFFFSLSCGSK